MTAFSWIHLTDLHQGMRDQRWLCPNVKEIFFEDIKRLHDKSGPWDLVLFTGDLTQRGDATEFDALNDLLAELWVCFAQLGSVPKLLTVPGNHDLSRPPQRTAPVRLLQQWSEQPEVQAEFWEDAESSYRQVVTDAFGNYSEWWETASYKPENIQGGILPGDFAVTLHKDGIKVGIVGLNTSFLQLTGDNYEKKLALHVRQFHSVCNDDGPAWAKQHHFCLLLTHHPFSWLSSKSQQHLAEELLTRGRFAVHLSGHLHKADLELTSRAGTEGQLACQGRSLFGLEYYMSGDDKTDRSFGYTVGRIKLSDNSSQGSLVLWPRVSVLQGGQRNMVPDMSLRLTDANHTHPQLIELLQPFQKKIYLSQRHDDERSDQRITSQATSPERSQVSKKPIVLVFEDQPSVRANLRITLSKEKFPIHEAERGAEFVNKLKIEKIDVVILDLQVPNFKNKSSMIAGFEYLEYVKNNYPDIPVIVFSAYDIFLREVLMQGAFDYIGKSDENAQKKIIQSIYRAWSERGYS